MSEERNRKFALLGIITLMIVLFTIKSPYFLSLENIQSILLESSTVGIIAIGMTFVIVTSGIDLSVGSIVAFVAMTIVNLFYRYHLSVPFVLIIAIIVSGLIGLINGLLITKLELPDFIATLAMMGVFRGFTMLISIRQDGFIRNVTIPNYQYSFIGGKIGSVPNVFICFVILVIIAQILLKKTRSGTYIYAIGSDLQSSQLSGINIHKYKILAYVLCGLMCGVSSLFMTSRIMSSIPELAEGIEMNAITAVVIGGTSLMGGRGDIFGTCLGVFFLSILQNGIYKFGISASYEPIILGVIIILSILIDSIFCWFRKKSRGVKNTVSDL